MIVVNEPPNEYTLPYKYQRNNGFTNTYHTDINITKIAEDLSELKARITALEKSKKILPVTKLLQTDDAKVWAEQFMLIFKDRKDEIDEVLMISWFANAMCAAQDKYAREHDAPSNS